MVSLPGGATPQAGTSTVLDCSATAGNPAALTYEWKKSGTVVQASSAMSSYTFTPDSADDGQTFTCTASNGIGIDPSASISLAVNSKINCSFSIQFPTRTFCYSCRPAFQYRNHRKCKSIYWGLHSYLDMQFHGRESNSNHVCVDSSRYSLGRDVTVFDIDIIIKFKWWPGHYMLSHKYCWNSYKCPFNTDC